MDVAATVAIIEKDRKFEIMTDTLLAYRLGGEVE
jgi:hypothetical protein